MRAIHAALTSQGLLAIINWHQRPHEETTALGQPRGPASELRMPPGATVQPVAPGGFTLVKGAEVSP